MPIAIITMLALLLGGGGAAVVSQSSLPGDTLFPVKLATENIRGFVVVGDDSNKEFHIDLAEKRVKEIGELVTSDDFSSRSDERKVEDINIAIDNLNRHLSDVEDRARELRDNGEITEAIAINGDFASSLSVLNSALDRERSILENRALRNRLDDTIDINEDRRVRIQRGIREIVERERVEAENAPDRAQAASGKIEAASNRVAQVERRLSATGDRMRPETISEAGRLLNEANNLLNAARTDLNSNRFFDAFDKANQALRFASAANALLSADAEFRNIEDNPNRIAENIVRENRQDNQGLKVEARVIANATDARVEVRFTTASTARLAIAREILNRVQLNRNQIVDFIEIKNELNQDLQTRNEARADRKDSLVEVRAKIRFPLNTTNTEAIVSGIANKLASLTISDIADILEIRINDNSGNGSSNSGPGSNNSGQGNGNDNDAEDRREDRRQDGADDFINGVKLRGDGTIDDNSRGDDTDNIVDGVKFRGDGSIDDSSSINDGSDDLINGVKLRGDGTIDDDSSNNRSDDSGRNRSDDNVGVGGVKLRGDGTIDDNSSGGDGDDNDRGGDSGRR